MVWPKQMVANDTGWNIKVTFCWWWKTRVALGFSKFQTWLLLLLIIPSFVEEASSVRHVYNLVRFHWQNSMRWGRWLTDGSCTFWNLNGCMFISCMMFHTLALGVFTSLAMTIVLGLSSIHYNTASSNYTVCTLRGLPVSCRGTLSHEEGHKAFELQHDANLLPGSLSGYRYLPFRWLGRASW